MPAAPPGGPVRGLCRGDLSDGSARATLARAADIGETFQRQVTKEMALWTESKVGVIGSN